MKPFPFICCYELQGWTWIGTWKSWANLGYVHTNPDFFFKTAYIFTRIVPPSTRNQWIWTPNLHCFETTFQTGLRPRPHHSKKLCGFSGVGSRGGVRGGSTPLFLDQTEARRVEKFFWDQPPLSQGLDDRASPPPSFIWLRVWIRHCLDLSRLVCTWPYCVSNTHRGLGPRDLKRTDRAEYLGLGTRQMFHHTSVLTTAPPLFPVTPGHIYVEQKRLIWAGNLVNVINPSET